MFRRRFFLFFLLVVVLVAEAVVVAELMAVASPELMAMVLAELTEGVSAELKASSMTVASKLVGKIYDCRVINWLCSMSYASLLSHGTHAAGATSTPSLGFCFGFMSHEGGSGDPPKLPEDISKCRHHF